jgi:hypothetical protein
MSEGRRGMRKSYAAFFFAATWIALIIAIVFGVDTPALILHAVAAALGVVAVVIAWRGPINRSDDPMIATAIICTIGIAAVARLGLPRGYWSRFVSTWRR